jgi:hypothetical protein
MIDCLSFGRLPLGTHEHDNDIGWKLRERANGVLKPFARHRHPE